MVRSMTATERAARDVLNCYAREGWVTRAAINRTIRDGLAVAEDTVRQQYRDGVGSAVYYGGKVAEEREDYDAASGEIATRLKVRRLLAAEMFAAVFAVVESEEGPRGETLTPEQAESVMSTVRDTAREMREPTATPATAVG